MWNYFIYLQQQGHISENGAYLVPLVAVDWFHYERYREGAIFHLKRILLQLSNQNKSYKYVFHGFTVFISFPNKMKERCVFNSCYSPFSFLVFDMIESFKI